MYVYTLLYVKTFLFSCTWIVFQIKKNFLNIITLLRNVIIRIEVELQVFFFLLFFFATFFFIQRNVYTYVHLAIQHMHQLLCSFCTTFVYRHHKYISMNNMNIIKVSEFICWSKIQYKVNKELYWYISYEYDFVH